MPWVNRSILTIILIWKLTILYDTYLPVIRHLVGDAERLSVAAEQNLGSPEPSRPTDLRQDDRNVLREGQLRSIAGAHGQDGAQAPSVSDVERIFANLIRVCGMVFDDWLLFMRLPRHLCSSL